ncbi:MAG: dihydroorotate dehydrogenase-like protein [Proteiniphilum sp.]|jgi:dihydroorotate dehydrogenase (fumarate)|nr:dihydroorotate dehydrogenase-like protein [Proteiniphilum sp.]
MNNLETSYMGLRLNSPVILGASELTSNPDMLKKAEEQGAAAVVYKTLFEEQIQMENLHHDEKISQYNDIHAEMITLHPDVERSDIEYYLQKIRKVKESLTIPVIASLNAVNVSSWFRYAKLIEETGVDGIEMNLYQVPTRFDLDAATIEQQQISIVAGIKEQLSIPVSVKLSSDYTNILHFAKRLDDAGVDGMVLFNAFFQPDIDIRKESHKRVFNLTRKGEYKKSLRYAGMLFGRVNADVCSSRGIFTGEDVIKLLLTGASCVQVVSAVYKHGIERIGEINREVSEWMEKKEYSSISQFRGKLSDSVLNKNDTLLIYKRAQYIDLLLHSDTILSDLEW